MPVYYVSYVLGKETPIASNCSPFLLNATDRTSRFPYADNP
jgi:hypothetical protein